MRHSIPHSLPVAEARQLIERAFAHYKERHPKYSPELRWLDEGRAELGATVRGHKLTAELHLQAGKLDLEMSAPLIFRPFSGLARQTIDREVQKWLSGEPPTA